MNTHLEDDFLIKPKNDYVFKKIFGDERNKELLISLLNSILKEKVEDVTLVNTDLMPEYIGNKSGILDVRAITDKGVHIDIEIQVLRISHMPERSLFYWSKMYIDQIASGDDYERLKKAIAINILDYNCIKNEKCHNSFHVREDEENFILSDVLEIHFVEIKKPYKDYENDKLAQWIEFLKADSKEVLEKMAETSEDLKRALDVLLSMSQDKATRAAYLSREMALRDEISRIAEGRAEGREEGIQLTKKVLKLFSQGEAIETIAEIYGVSVEIVKEIIE